ncbi:PucR family transcriptional regulator [Leucobacter sp. USHLN153]|uniref:PucR family transcriptional regulator n=1 Tax=Leucobacter sp. USHLN153 TaxID=3081268 RepID=UPI00301B08FA
MASSASVHVVPPSSPAASVSAPALSPTIELGELLHQYHLQLAMIAGASPEAAARPVQWVHVSELEDPTPFLTPRTVLLTTGARFGTMHEAADAEDYVRRLIETGVTALGFAVGLHWDRVPPPVVAACDRLDLPLFRVPYDTAFIEIVQTAARLLEAKTRDRDLWSLESQRAVANASLHRDGLGAAVREASARLGRWVCIVDRFGRLVEFSPESERAGFPADGVRREARRILDRGVSAARIEAQDGSGMQLQALGRHDHVLGVLAIEERGVPDTAERALHGLVAALATVQLEHRSGIRSAQAALRNAIAELLIAEHLDLAERLSHGVLSRFPVGDVVVVRFAAADHPAPSFAEDLQSLDAGSPGLFTATVDGSPLIVAEARHLPAIRRLFTTHELPAGISGRGPLDRIGASVVEAGLALDRAVASASTGPIDYLPALHEGVLHLLDEEPEARRRAMLLLAPVRQHDERHGDRIEEALGTWLAHHGQTSAAATELGLHRHTLRTRVQTAGQLLQSDLESPDTRAELWAALRLTARAQ